MGVPGKTQISDGTCAEVRRRLTAQQSVSQIARELGLGRELVRAIRDGQSAGPAYGRCPNGHLTLLPCLTCEIRSLACPRAESPTC